MRAATPAELAQGFPFRDARYAELLFRYRARWFPDTLTEDERDRWRRFRTRRLTREDGLASITLPHYRELVASLRDGATSSAHSVLDALEAWGDGVASAL